MSNKIFDVEEFENLNGPQIQQLGNTIYQRFAQKRNYYHQSRNSQFVSPQDWDELNKVITEFDTKFNNWNRTWGNTSRQQNSQAFINYFNQILPEYEKMDEIIEKVRPKYEHSEPVEELKQEILAKVDSDLANLANNFELQISEGIQNLIDLKAEYKLQDTFAVSVKKEKDAANTERKIYLGLFIASVFLIPTFLLISFTVDKLNALDISLQWSVRITISVTLGLLSLFFFNQYRVSRLILLKYTHLNNFIGGGATFISELIGLNEDSKRDVNKKLANMFIEIDDLMNSIRRSKHPSEKAMDSANKLIDSVTKGATEITKAVK
ncbi:hypothetical protein RM697_02805 [Ichthyenterobacterium sp. W332]|uniref:Uncharacterized protein n=1 Tax=Microcosmobacter mediterraneus TaxID=3075607 RepID=A0ABU2YHQ9_9FLAO|nr:hypothetical protein [Ichthyenterobacterium sp. W332]MDT0557562.1 hypothetical protein [Ichthyenterobacterium sp. W332]